MEVDQAGEAMVIIVRGDGTTTPIRVQHDSVAAPIGDIVFVAYCREDVNYLLRALALRDNLEAARIQDITERLNGSTPGQWKAFLEPTGAPAASRSSPSTPRPTKTCTCTPTVSRPQTPTTSSSRPPTRCFRTFSNLQEPGSRNRPDLPLRERACR
jgi:hypothetical protein